MTYKIVSTFILLFIICSCASTVKHRVIVDSSNEDTFSGESLTRKSYKLMSTIDSNHSLCHQRQFSQAFSRLKEQLDSRKDDPLYWEEMGTCYYLNSEYQKALLFLEIAGSKTKINKIKSKIFNNMALVYLKLGKIQKAHSLLEESIILNSEILTARFNLALIYMTVGQEKLAKRELNILYGINKNDPEVILGLSQIYFSEGKADTALALIKKIPQQYYNDSVVVTMAKIFYLKNQSENAQKLLNKHNIAVEEVLNDYNKSKEVTL